MEKEFIELINKHQGILHKICNIYFIRNPYKEDYYQEILIRLWKSYPGFKNQSVFSTWLYRVALNTAIDIIRKQNLQPRHSELTKIEYNIPDIWGVKNLSWSNKILPLPLLGFLILILLFIPWFIKYQHNQRYKKIYSSLNDSARLLNIES